MANTTKNSRLIWRAKTSSYQTSKNIFTTGELQEEVVSSILEHTTLHGAIEGKTQEIKVKYYNLDAIISVGYRVNSTQATAFRIWATERLKEYIIKGFTMDDERSTPAFVAHVAHESKQIPL